MKRLTIALCLALLASPALACGEGQDQTGCNPPPPPPPPPEKPPATPGDDRDPPVPTVLPAYMPCCIRDDVVLAHAPLGIGDAVSYCQMVLDTQPQSIPACKIWETKK